MRVHATGLEIRAQGNWEDCSKENVDLLSGMARASLAPEFRCLVERVKTPHQSPGGVE